MIEFHAAQRVKLAAMLAERGPGLVVVRAAGGAGVSTLVRSALPAGRRRVWHTAAPLADADNRALLGRRLVTALGDPVEDDEPSREAGSPVDAPDWDVLLDRLRAHVDAAREPLIVVLDDAQLLLAARSRLPDLLAGFWAGVRAHALPLHLVLAGRSAGALEDVTRGGALAPSVDLDLALGAVGYREATAAMAPWPARDRLLGWSVFGGAPAVLHRVDAAVSLATNVRRLVLEPDAPFLHRGADLLAGALQSPARYGSVLRALALGRREWGELVEAVPEFGSAGQLAPYLARMEALGWIEVERSLDAPARSRSRRYRIGDPFLAFWFRFVAPHRAEIEAGEGAALWSRSMRPGLDRHMALHFGPLCRAWLLHHGDERLPGRAREAGGLWGQDYDLEVAATLRTGAACYGRSLWSEAPAGMGVVEELDRAIAATRYGFGRESRVRLVFSAAGFDAALQRRSAREPPVRLIGLEDLVGA